MHKNEQRPLNAYPTGRGYGNDYMRGGEVFGGYGYADRPEYERRRGDTAENELSDLRSTDAPAEESPPGEPSA
jgi:hypothetical protein